jgi:hypothetical protein
MKNEEKKINIFLKGKVAIVDNEDGIGKEKLIRNENVVVING